MKDDKTPPELIVKRALDIIAPDGVFELRIPKAGPSGTIAGYFDDHSIAAGAIVKLNKHKYPGIYVTLNPINPVLLARMSNRTEARMQTLSADSDVVSRRWLPMDFDPRRPSGVSSTDEEHQAALDRAAEVRDWLAGQGWPAPVMADSGNGAHLLYPVDVPNTADVGKLFGEVVRAVAAVWTDDRVIVDETVHNASRIWKVYGTISRKGDDLPERPHREARLLSTPQRINVTIEQMEALAAPTRTERSDTLGPRGRRINDLGEYAESLGLHVVAGPLPLFGRGHKWLLDKCPFNPDHEKPIIGIVEGRPLFRCLHNSCSTFGWRAFREKVDPGYSSPESIVEKMLADNPHDPKWLEALARLSERDYHTIRARLKAEGTKNLRQLDKGVHGERQRQIELEAADAGVPGNVYGLSLQIRQLQSDGVLPHIWLNELDGDRYVGDAQDRTLYQDHRHGARIHGEFHKRGIKWVNPATIDQAINLITEYDGSRNPMQEYFQALSWDKKPRIDVWLSTYLGTESADYHQQVGRKWLISAVARAMNPGCQADHMLILEGPQGIGKSQALRILGGDFFVDFGGQLNSTSDHQQFVSRMLGKSIVEMSELSSFKRSGIESLKHMLTITSDRIRLAYRRAAGDYKRTCVFAGTTNEVDTKYINDPTGARRFWPVLCQGKLDLEGLQSARDQLWAEAMAAYRAGEEWWIRDLSVTAEQQEARQSRVEDDTWFETILERLVDSESWKDQLIMPHQVGMLNTGSYSCRIMMNIGQIMAVWLGVPIKDQHPANTSRAIAALNKLGFRSRAVGTGDNKRKYPVMQRDKTPDPVWFAIRPMLLRMKVLPEGIERDGDHTVQ